MKRRTFDKIMTAMGLGLTIFLFATAALLNWGASFASQSVTDQLTPQKIMFPAPDSEGLNALPAADKAAVEKYAGQQVTTGEQARVYATNYIGVHVKGVAGGKTYSEVSGEALGKMAASKADPKNAALAAEAAALMGQRTTLFMGETLKGLSDECICLRNFGNNCQDCSSSCANWWLGIPSTNTCRLHAPTSYRCGCNNLVSTLRETKRPGKISPGRLVFNFFIY